MLGGMHQWLRHGFVEHGHARGAPALIVTCSPGARVTAAFILEHVRPGERVHLHVTHRSAAAAARASAMSVVLRAACGCNVSACVLPGVRLASDKLAFESTMRVSEGDGQWVTADSLDTRLASVSVNYWPGSGMLETISAGIRAERGLYLVLDKADIGDAKVYLQGHPRSRWHIVHNYSLNDLTSAEFDEMTAGAPRGKV